MAFPENWGRSRSRLIGRASGAVENCLTEVYIAEGLSGANPQTTSKFPTAYGTFSPAPYSNAFSYISSITADDDSCTHVGSSGNMDTGEYTYILYGKTFGLALFEGIRILGIEVEIEKRQVAGDACDAIVQLSKNGTDRVGDNKATSDSYSAVLTKDKYGGPTDLWGTTWTPAELNSANFAVHYAGYAKADDAYIEIDYYKVTVYWEPMICLDGHIRSDLGDLRFSNAADAALPYYIHTITGTTPNQFAKVHVKLDAVATADTEIKCWYDNPTATSESSFADICSVYDEFERGANGDAPGGDWTVVSGTVQISTAQAYSGTRSMRLDGGATRAKATIPLTAVSGVSEIEEMVRKEDYAGDVWPIMHGDGSKCIKVGFNTSESLKYLNAAGTTIYPGSLKITIDTWTSLKINNINFAAGTFDLYFGGSLAASGAEMHTSADAANVLQVFSDDASAGDECWIDDFTVHPWLAVPPVWQGSDWGEEQTYGAPTGPAGIKSVNGILSAAIKSRNTTAWSAIKALNN